jgi:RNA polymerase sigma factor FliA
MFELFTDRARRVVVLSQDEARMLGHDSIGAEHLLLGLVDEGEGVGAKAVQSLGIPEEAVLSRVEHITGRGQTTLLGHLPLAPSAKRALVLSLAEALWLGHGYVGTGHLLVGLIREGGVAAQVLHNLGADLDRARERVARLLSGQADQGEGRPQDQGPPGRSIQRLATTGLLAGQAMDDLWWVFKHVGSDSARDQLAERYTLLVDMVATRVGTHLLQGRVAQAELASYGTFGLLDALETFDPGRGVEFVAYAIPRIRGAIIDELRSLDWVPRSVLFKARDIEKATTELETRLRRPPTDAEIAEYLGIRIGELHDIVTQVSFWSAPDPISGMEGTEIRAMLAKAVNSLSEQEKKMLTLYYLEGLTLAEIGEVLGVTESRVCQIHTKAVECLRKYLPRDGEG